jgi:hypothetical protein
MARSTWSRYSLFHPVLGAPLFERVKLTEEASITSLRAERPQH